MEERKRKAKRFSEAFKRQIIEEYRRSGIPKDRLQKKYSIKSKSAILNWMRALGYVDGYEKSNTLEVINPFDLARKKQKNSTSSTCSLEAENALLKQQLEDERLRSQMFNRMIDIAEKEYKIAIRKNSNTK